MNLEEAYEALDVDSSTPDYWIKANYRWFVKRFHPDFGLVKDDSWLRRTIEAYEIICKYRDRINEN